MKVTENGKVQFIFFKQETENLTVKFDLVVKRKKGKKVSFPQLVKIKR
jgi:hypothetical protein